jgi:rod shape-determining protein MreC
VIRLSIPLRQALARLSLPLLIAAAFGVMLLGKADALLAERLRMPGRRAVALLRRLPSRPGRSAPVPRNCRARDAARGECPLREENERLRRWQAAALALETENELLRRQLELPPRGRARLRHRPRRGRWRRHLCARRAARHRAAARHPQAARSRWTSAASSGA